MTPDDPEKKERDAQFQHEALSCLPDVTRFALSLTRSEADADDLVQETFLRAYRSWDQYAMGTECRGWLFTICRNTFLRARERARREVSSDDPELESLAAVAMHTAAVHEGQGDLFATVDLSAMALGSLIGHPVYGAIVGAVYGTGAAEATRRHALA
jgi:RNA polymerase sigma-70 factor (ECF subfamily)